MRARAIATLAAMSIPTLALANTIEIIGGETSVVLDTETLSAAASLDLSGVSDAVVVPGALDGSVAFRINPRDAEAPLLATTFAFEAGDFLGSFSGTIEHEGSVFFNDDTVEVGNFTIGFDAARATGNASGFYVASTVGIPAILFDVAAPSTLRASVAGAKIGADLLVSPEFAAFLEDNGLAAADLTGADVGDALVQAGGGCSGADVTDNDYVNKRDLRQFVRAWIYGDASADFNGNGRVNGADLAGFIRLWIRCLG